MDLQSGMVFAVPIPEKDSANAHTIQEAIEKSLWECEQMGVHGKDVTPFVLKNVAKLTEDKSLQASMST
jgi:pseudouridine-5'-phosphate glycosidase